MPSHETDSSPRWAGVAVAFLALCGFGAAEAALAIRGFDWATATSHARTVAMTLAVHGACGLILGLAAVALDRFRRNLAKDARVLAIGCVVFFVVALRVAVQSAGLTGFLAGLGLGAVLGRLAILAATRVPFLALPRTYGTGAGLLLAIDLALVAGGLADPSLRRLTYGVAVVGLALGATNFAPVAPLLALAATIFVAGRAQLTSGESSAKGPSILLVTIDTLRADRIGVYGDAHAKTPTIDALAAKGARFNQAIVPTTLTGPSHMSILSGLLPTRHGVTLNLQKLSAEIPILPELFQRDGYATAAFVSGFPLTERASGLPRRFEFSDDDMSLSPWLPEQLTKRISVFRIAFREDKIPRAYRRTAEATTDRVTAWLGQNQGPFFLWVHYYDPHLPYAPPDRFLSDTSHRQFDWYRLPAEARMAVVHSPTAIANAKFLYGAEISRVDEQLSRLIEVATHTANDQLIVALTSDHGEAMGEHQLWWGRDLHDPTLHVPLIIAPPTGDPFASTVVKAQVRSIDIAPTLLELAGLPIPSGLDGISLRPWLHGQKNDESGAALSIARHEPEQPSLKDSDSVRTNGWKLIQTRESLVTDRLHPVELELFDLTADPTESLNRAMTATRSLALLETKLSEIPDPTLGRRLLTSDDEAALRSLGYVQ